MSSTMAVASSVNSQQDDLLECAWQRPAANVVLKRNRLFDHLAEMKMAFEQTSVYRAARAHVGETLYGCLVPARGGTGRRDVAHRKRPRGCCHFELRFDPIRPRGAAPLETIADVRAGSRA